VVEIRRGAEELRVEIHSGTLRDDQRPLRKLALFAAGLGFYLVGLALGLAKPEDRLTRRAALTLLVFAGYQLNQTLNSNFYLFTFWERVVFALIYLGFPFQFALAYRFYYRFPQSAPRGRVWTALECLLCLWGGLLAIAWGGSAIEASKIAGQATVSQTGDYTVVQLKRQEELTRAIQGRRAKANAENPEKRKQMLATLEAA
jgi:hypothetical protein